MTWPRPTPTPARPGPTRELWESSLPRRPAARDRALTRSRLRGRQAARAEAGGRRPRRAGSREAGGSGGQSARRWRDPRLPPTPRWRPSRLLLRPAKSGTFKNPCARNRPPARPRTLPPPSAPPRPAPSPSAAALGPGPAQLQLSGPPPSPRKPAQALGTAWGRSLLGAEPSRGGAK